MKAKTKKQKSWRAYTAAHVELRDAIYPLTPDIAYFPTLVFDFPKTIFLTDRGTAVDKFYRRVFQDILDYDGKGHTIERDVVGQYEVLQWYSLGSRSLASGERMRIAPRFSM